MWWLFGSHWVWSSYTKSKLESERVRPSMGTWRSRPSPSWRFWLERLTRSFQPEDPSAAFQGLELLSNWIVSPPPAQESRGLVLGISGRPCQGCSWNIYNGVSGVFCAFLKVFIAYSNPCEKSAQLTQVKSLQNRLLFASTLFGLCSPPDSLQSVLVFLSLFSWGLFQYGHIMLDCIGVHES